MTYLHTGIPVGEKLEGMDFVEPLKVWITHASNHPYNLEFLYFEPDSAMAAAIQCETHVAYRVDDIEAAVKGKSVLWPITDLGKMKIAFIMDADAVVELAQVL